MNVKRTHSKKRAVARPTGSLPAGLDRRAISSEVVKQAMSKVPRHLFVPEDQRLEAYSDRALGIGYEQTISQPYIVALMTQEAEIKAGSKVLEIGTGSGYQAAVLCEMGAVVYSIEIVEELAERARKTLADLHYNQVTVKVGDGAKGWPEQAPFDAIIVTAASPSVPPALVEQLAEGGHLVIPIEEQGEEAGERLMVFQRQAGDLHSRDLGPVRFVPMTGTIRANNSANKRRETQ